MSWIAIIGAMVHILVAGVKNIEEVLEKGWYQRKTDTITFPLPSLSLILAS
jgi:hypothetical protein